MISRRLVIGLIGAGAVAVALYAVPLAQALSPELRNARLDQTLRGLVEGRSTPGVVALILQNGQPVYSRSVGVREVGGTALIGESDMFRLASMTKAVTSVAAMILIEQGQIGLETRGRHRESNRRHSRSFCNRTHCKAPSHPELCVQRT